MDKHTLILEKITDKNTKLVKSKVELYANDDGKVYLSLPTVTHELMYNEVITFDSRWFLYFRIDKDSKSKVLFPLSNRQVELAEDFFDYWTDKRLIELKQAKWNSFCEYWQIVFKFVEDNVDLANNNVTYEYHSNYYDDGDGDVFNHFDIHLGGEYFGSKEELGEDYYHHYFNISGELQAILIDNYLENKDGLRWFSGIHVQFKP